MRPLLLADPADPRGWAISDAYGFGPALWVAPVLEQGATEREVQLPRGDWIDWWTGERVARRRRGDGRRAARPDPAVGPRGLDRRDLPRGRTSPPASATRRSRERPLEATLWGEPPLGRAAVRLADGTRIAWHAGRWRLDRDREVAFSER